MNGATVGPRVPCTVHAQPAPSRGPGYVPGGLPVQLGAMRGKLICRIAGHLGHSGVVLHMRYSMMWYLRYGVIVCCVCVTVCYSLGVY